MKEAQLVKAIRAHVAKGDSATDKAEQHYVSAGLHLKTLKEQHRGNWAEWEVLLKDKVGIGKSRASELMQIADGKKTVEQVRSATAKRVAKHSAEISPLANGENSLPAPLQHQAASVDADVDLTQQAANLYVAVGELTESLGLEGPMIPGAPEKLTSDLPAGSALAGIAAFRRKAAKAAELAEYSGVVNSDVVRAASDAALAWADLLVMVSGKLRPPAGWLRGITDRLTAKTAALDVIDQQRHQIAELKAKLAEPPTDPLDDIPPFLRRTQP
jgi:hypothetical protein